MCFLILRVLAVLAIRWLMDAFGGWRIKSKLFGGATRAHDQFTATVWADASQRRSGTVRAKRAFEATNARLGRIR
jgi:hypothetical protein